MVTGLAELQIARLYFLLSDSTAKPCLSFTPEQPRDILALYWYHSQHTDNHLLRS